MKDLPKVFANTFDKQFHNNSNFSYGKLEEARHSRDDRYVLDKINRIFKNENTLYSIDCVIKFESDEAKHTIIGKTNNNLITKNQKLIPIKDIYDIDLA